MSRLTQILRGKKLKPMTELESAVKYAVDNAGSGGGGGGGAEPLVVTMVQDIGSSSIVGDKTYGECYEAFTAGRTIFVNVTSGIVEFSFMVVAANKSGSGDSAKYSIYLGTDTMMSTFITASKGADEYLVHTDM